MRPSVVTVRWLGSGGWRRVHVPVAPVVLVLSPLLLIVALGVVIARRATRVDIDLMEAGRGLGRLLWALPGTEFSFEQGRRAVLVSVI